MDTQICTEGSVDTISPVKRYVFLTADIETDSLEIADAEILEIGASLIRQPLYPLDCASTYASFVYHRRVPSEVTTLTGIDTRMTEKAKPFDQVCNEFIKWLETVKEATHADYVLLLFHNGNQFDVPILQKMLKRYSMSMPEWVMCADSYEMVESICHQTFPFGKRSLKALSHAMNIAHPPHRALGDAECLAGIIQRIPKFTSFHKETIDEWFVYTAQRISKKQ
jgi:DNA polymerase III epsilon subunit-like protein